MIGVAVSGHNCREWSHACADSILSQKVDGYVRTVVVDDASDDGTAEDLANVPDPGFSVIRMASRSYTTICHRAAIEALRPNPEDIIVVMDLDDELLPGALERILRAHKDGAWVTYGNWKDQHGDVNPHVSWNGDRLATIRDVPWFLTHAMSLRAGLYFAIPESYWTWNATGEPYEMDFDGPLMYAAVDLAGGDRVVGIAEPIYMYRRSYENSVIRKWPFDLRKKEVEEQKAKPRLAQMERLD